MDSSLLWEMVQRMSVAATLAFLLSQFATFRRMIYRQGTFKEKAAIAIVFWIHRYFGNLFGIPLVMLWQILV